MRSYTLELTVFITGIIILIYEISGARVLGPYFGTSSFVWTSLIGIILASLAIGYYIGGRLADKGANYRTLGLLLFLSSIALIIAIFIKDPFLILIRNTTPDIRIGSVISALVLFLPPSILLGMISPYALRLKLSDMKTAGATIGDMGAISTAGSILGSFLAGFWLLPFMGVNTLLFSLPITLILLSLFVERKSHFGIRIITLILVIIWMLGRPQILPLLRAQGVIDEVDTIYSHIRIIDQVSPFTREKVRILGINAENHSAMSLESDTLVNEYTKYYHLVRHFVPHFEKGLMFGGAGYSFPKDYLKKYPLAALDVVEIDPGVTELAQKYFNLKENPRLRIFHEDARVFLEKNTEKYDVIFGDAFSSWYSIPYQLTTREAVQKHYDALSDSGAVILNIISAIEGEQGRFLRAEYTTYKSIFPYVYIIPVTNPGEKDAIQNIMLVALKSKELPNLRPVDPELATYLSHLWTAPITDDTPILTDDYAPVDYYIGKLLEKL